MTSKSSTKSKLLLWIQLLVAVIAIAWLSYDFFHTVVNGMTYKLRFDEQLSFSQYPFAFVFAVAIKLAVFAFFIWLFRDCWRKLK